MSMIASMVHANPHSSAQPPASHSALKAISNETIIHTQKIVLRDVLALATLKPEGLKS
jgi:hypothetical protein